ncbi:hypothetical protein HKCCSP123_13335 [Rhodobacterales bacterium HKCCSP123]|nr:hypothetical protein [Rhodobacterales bacterium HKCCSP123]
MFEGHDRQLLVAALMVGVLVSVALQGLPPEGRAPIAVDVSALPPVPATAAPDGTPLQTDVPERTVDLGGGFEATLMHGYVLEGEVVTRREFWRGTVSAVSPLDLGIVWGNLAPGSATDAVAFRAGHRMVSFQPLPGIPLSGNWEVQVTNNHLVPASDAVRDALLAVRPGDRVRLRGYLVTVTGEGMAPWQSSTRRDDNTIIGGCEIILVREVEILSASSAT